MESALVDAKATHIESNKQVAFAGISIIKVKNGKAIETLNVFNKFKLYEQLGYELIKK
jgi:hypothetical protein